MLLPARAWARRRSLPSSVARACDDALIRLGPLLRHASSVSLPPEPLLGGGRARTIGWRSSSALLRSLAYVQEPAPSGKVDLVLMLFADGLRPCVDASMALYSLRRWRAAASLRVSRNLFAR